MACRALYSTYFMWSFFRDAKQPFQLGSVLPSTKTIVVIVLLGVVGSWVDARPLCISNVCLLWRICSFGGLGIVFCLAILMFERDWLRQAYHLRHTGQKQRNE